MVTQQQIAGMQAGMERLREKLKAEKWPQKYMFKFVLPNDRTKLDNIMELLPTNGKVTFRDSKGGKYVGVTCVAEMSSADAVMSVTSAVCAIEGVISL